ncbi:MAG: exopolysaccharide biosynthesis protein [Pseudomonadota bacterium]|nr:exopolysaccharide biosynthesis protein [Pseudomonadota bacterium]
MTTADTNMTPTTRPESVAGILNRARYSLDGDEVSVRDVVEAMGRASFAPLLMLPAMIVASPASGIPLLSSICGISIALISFQMIARRDHVWLPDWIMRRHAPKARIRKALDWLCPPALFLDRITQQRVTFLVEPPFLLIPQIICLLAGGVMPLLEFVPFTSSILGIAVSVMAVAMVTRDGLLVIAGLSAIVGAFALGQYLIVG